MTFKTCLKQHVGSNTIVSDIVATTINVMTENMQEVRLICKNIQYFQHFNSDGHNGFLHEISVTLIDKTDAKNPIKREHY